LLSLTFVYSLQRYLPPVECTAGRTVGVVFFRNSMATHFARDWSGTVIRYL